MHEDRMQGCTHARLCRITRHDAIGHWLHDHIAARKKWTVIHEQKTWASTPAPARSLPVPPDTRQAVDSLVQPRSVASYSGQMQARGARTVPIVLGTNGTVHGEPEAPGMPGC